MGAQALNEPAPGSAPLPVQWPAGYNSDLEHFSLSPPGNVPSGRRAETPSP